MNVLKYGFEIRNGFLYNVPPKVKPKPPEPLKPDKYEEMLKTLDIPVDVFMKNINELILSEQPRVIPFARAIPGSPPPPPRPADAQAVIDKMNSIQRRYEEIHARFRNPEARFMSAKTYVRHMGSIRRELTNFVTIPNLRPLNEEDLIRTYEQNAEIRENLETEISEWKNI